MDCAGQLTEERFSVYKKYDTKSKVLFDFTRKKNLFNLPNVFCIIL